MKLRQYLFYYKNACEKNVTCTPEPIKSILSRGRGTQFPENDDYFSSGRLLILMAKIPTYCNRRPIFAYTAAENRRKNMHARPKSAYEGH